MERKETIYTVNKETNLIERAAGANTMQVSNLLSYAASLSNPPKGYGSIDKGLEVSEYRCTRLDYYMAQGHNYAQAATLAHRDVIARYGEPF